MNQTPKPTWQSYLRQLGSGINGIAERSKRLTEADIIANAQAYMQMHYPGRYTVEQFYNAQKFKIDLRLRFDNPRDETWFRIQYG